MRTAALLLALGLPLALGACRAPYYWTMEKLGKEKRDLFVDRVEEGRDAQVEAKEQFESALEAFRLVHDFDGGDLEAVYDRLSDELEESEERADEVRSRIGSIERVAGDLFEEWEDEAATLQDEGLREQSLALKADTEARYAGMLSSMKSAEARMEVVVGAFRDRVLFLKHNLNARAIASLSGELRSIESDVGDLIREMEGSIAEVNAFLADMG